MTATRNPTGHPAPYSDEVLAVFANLIPAGTHVHDPFAGGGDRLGKLADAQGWTFSGTELEKPFIVDERVMVGNACDPLSYPPPSIPFVVVTSPVYPNGIADDFNAQDGSERRTYRAALAKLRGVDAEMHPDNQGRWGYRGTPLYSNARHMYWHIARRAIKAMGEAQAIYINVSDFMVGSTVEPVVHGWAARLESQGWRVQQAYPVLTRRYRNGTNRDARVANEVILHLKHGDSGTLRGMAGRP